MQYPSINKLFFWFTINRNIYFFVLRFDFFLTPLNPISTAQLALEFYNFTFSIFSVIFKLINEINGLFCYKPVELMKLATIIRRKLNNKLHLKVFLFWGCVCVFKGINKITKILIITFESFVDDEILFGFVSLFSIQMTDIHWNGIGTHK